MRTLKSYWPLLLWVDLREVLASCHILEGVEARDDITTLGNMSRSSKRLALDFVWFNDHNGRWIRILGHKEQYRYTCHSHGLIRDVLKLNAPHVYRSSRVEYQKRRKQLGPRTNLRSWDSRLVHLCTLILLVVKGCFSRSIYTSILGSSNCFEKNTSVR